MNLPQGQLLRRRVLGSLETVLDGALDRELTGYARLEPQDTLLLDTDHAGVITFEDGVPVAVYHTGIDAGGEAALTEIASSGPYRLELYELDGVVLDEVHQVESFRVSPERPAELLSGTEALIERTRNRAPDRRIEQDTTADSDLDAIESFLDDDEKIETIRDRAQTEAASRADEWKLPVE